MKPTLIGRNALLEIGVEELPARFISPALVQLKKEIASGLTSNNLPYAEVEVWGTPRRLVAFIRDVAPKGADRTDIAIGPPPAAAKDASGAWTQTALGFAKAQKVSVDKLEIQSTAKGERLVAVRHIPGQKTELILKELFPSVIRKLVFPKSMIWEEDQFRFARPLRWIVALYHTKIIRFTIAHVQSDRATMGLLALGGKKIPIQKPDRYKSILQTRCILVDPAERRKKIEAQLESTAKRVKGTAVTTEDHIEEVVQLTEYPVSVLGSFPESYLKLPKEVLAVVLRKHQKFFPIEIQKGKLTNAFIGVRNGLSEHQDIVREGYERVTNARLADAQFFFEKDSQTPLEQLVPRLAEVGFHQKLGSLLDKTNRVVHLIEKIGPSLGLDPLILSHAKRAATLAKTDLLTHMVGELPELQGVAGRFYAEKQEPAQVAEAIEQHYWPLTTDGALPKTDEAALVALLDKMDTLAGNFSVGLVPSGSADPYGQRRLAVGIIRILIEKKWSLSLAHLITSAFDGLPSHDKSQQQKTALEDFFVQRFLNWFGNQGYRTDEMEAVLSNRNEPLTTVYEKLNGLKSIREKPEFDSLSTAIKRATNIIKQAEERGVMPASQDVLNNGLGDMEKILHQSIDHIRPHLDEALRSRDFPKAFLALAPLKDPVDQFFEGVMIMVEDESIRSQRLALLREVKQLFDSLADFSKLQPAAGPAAKAKML